MKKIIAVALSALVLITAAVGGTLAMISAEEHSLNVYTAGDIEIELINTGDDSVTLFPVVYDLTPDEGQNVWALGGNGLWANVGNALNKRIAVKNTGDNPAYVRVLIAFENPKISDNERFTDKLKFNSAEGVSLTKVVDVVVIEGVEYAIYSYTFGAALAAGQTSEDVLRQIALAMDTTSAEMATINGSFEVLACAQAVQIDPLGTNKPAEMLNAQFGEITATTHPWTDIEIAYANSADALATALSTNGSVILTDDIELNDQSITIAKNTSAVLHLNGHTISGVATSKAASNLITVAEGAELTILNGTISSYATTPSTGWTYATNTINCSGKLVIDGATIENKTPMVSGGASYAIDCYPGADLIVNSGVVKQSGGDVAIRMFANSDKVPTNVTINGGEIVGCRSVWIHIPGSNPASKKLANLTVNGGTLSSNETREGKTGYSIYSCSWGDSFTGTTVVINDGTFMNDVAFGDDYYGDRETVIINGGTFYGDVYRYTGPDTEVKIDLTKGTQAAVVDSNEKLQAAVEAGKTKIILETGDYSLRFTHITSFNLNNATLIGKEGVTLSISSSEVHYGRIQGDNVTFENIKFVNEKVGATGKATYKNCTFAGRLEFASSGSAETYADNCVILGDVHTSGDTSAGNAYISNSKIGKADYASSATVTFTNCEIGEVIIWSGNTVLNGCSYTSITNKGSGTLTIDGSEQ